MSTWPLSRTDFPTPQNFGRIKFYPEKGLTKFQEEPRYIEPVIVDVTLSRPHVRAPWGISVHGGREHGFPLTISKVDVNGPAGGKIEVGELLIRVNGIDVGLWSHNQVIKLIREAGTSINLQLSRKNIWFDGYIVGKLYPAAKIDRHFHEDGNIVE